MTSDPKTTSTLYPLGGVVEDEVLKQLNGTVSKNDSYRVMSNARLGIKLFKGLSFASSLGIDFTQANGNVFEPSYLSVRNENKSTGNINRNISFANENLLTYKREIHGEHNLEVLLGMTYNHQQAHEINGYALRGEVIRCIMFLLVLLTFLIMGQKIFPLIKLCNIIILILMKKLCSVI